MPALHFLRGRKGIEKKPTAIATTPQGQWAAEAPETTAPTGRHDLFDVYSAWLGDPLERYGPLEVANGVPIKRKVAMMKDPILAMCIGYAGAMMINAKRVIKCKDAAKQRFFEAMFRMWEQEFILSANVGIALGAVGMVKKWRFMRPERVSVEDPDPWTGRAMPFIVKGFDILNPLNVSPKFDGKGRTFEGISTPDDDLDVFYSLWLTFRKELAFGSYYGAGRLDHCYKDWWMAEYGGDNYMIAMQKEADRVALVGYPPGQTGGVDNRTIAVQVGDRVRSGATAAFPTNVYETTNALDGTKSLTNVRRWTLEFLEGAGSFQRFHEIDDHHSKRKCLGYFIPPQTILDVKQSAVGGPTTADVLGDISIELLMQDAADMDRHLNRYVFPAVSKANFPPGSPEVRVETVGLDSDNLDQMFEIVKTLAPESEDVKYFDMRESMKRLGFPLRSEEDVRKAEEEAAKKAKAVQIAEAKTKGPPGEPVKDEEPKAAAEGDVTGPTGSPLAPWPANQQVPITADDVAEALVDWERLAPKEASGLLVALTEEG